MLPTNFMLRSALVEHSLDTYFWLHELSFRQQFAILSMKMSYVCVQWNTATGMEYV